MLGAITVVVLVSAMSDCSNEKKMTRTKIQLSDDPGPSRTSAAKKLVLPECPPAKLPMLTPQAPNTGHHRVILSWKAGAVSARAEDNAVGYCLYRSQTKDVAKKDPLCSQCEQVNIVPVPVPDTSCVDDVVQDGKTYYYVATAINQKKIISTTSNEVPARIPAGGKANSNPPAGVAFCRGSPASQQP